MPLSVFAAALGWTPYTSRSRVPFSAPFRSPWSGSGYAPPTIPSNSSNRARSSSLGASKLPS